MHSLWCSGSTYILHFLEQVVNCKRGGECSIFLILEPLSPTNLSDHQSKPHPQTESRTEGRERRIAEGGGKGREEERKRKEGAGVSQGDAELESKRMHTGGCCDHGNKRKPVTSFIAASRCVTQMSF